MKVPKTLVLLSTNMFSKCGPKQGQAGCIY